MAATKTVRAKPRLVYALPTRPPIPFPAQPSYPIRPPTRDLQQAYTDALWPPATSKQPDQVVFESFARLLLALLADKSPADFNTLVRGLLIPLQDFDRRWRDGIPAAVDPPEDDFPSVAGPSGLSDAEKAQLRCDFDAWSVQERKRLEEEREARKSKMTKGKERAKEGDVEMGDDEDEAEVTVRVGDWLTDKELAETRLQALLLFSLLSLPATFQPEVPKKGKKKKNPEAFADTLDPAMLLDFLTDRMQIWRVMQDVSDLEMTGEAESQEGEREATGPDVVQEWWQSVVEPLFRTRVDTSIVSHHRLKLFPAASQAERVAQRLAPAPSPFKPRSLLSLDRSARRRDLEEGKKLVAESPTMKRLLSMPSLGGARDKGKVKMLGERDEGDVFKVPGMPLKRKDSVSDAGVAAVEPAASGETTGRRLPRKQERPRPLPRGDSSTAGAKNALKRREVSLSKKPSSSALELKKKSSAAAVKEPEGRKRKRKSDSPKKLGASDRSAPTLTLVPDTPSKASSSKPVSGRKPFSRAPSLSSFAALGAAFRAGAADAPPPFGLAPPPSSSSRPPSNRPGAEDGMEWSSGEDDAWLDEREADWRRKGGRERQSSYNGDEEEPLQKGETQPQGLATPKKDRGVLLVPDT
ncbi:hypothetical protein JCM10207_002333 [Rhodosporidiobolus poonsookiae]